jgi:hypothetical protein
MTKASEIKGSEARAQAHYCHTLPQTLSGESSGAGQGPSGAAQVRCTTAAVGQQHGAQVVITRPAPLTMRLTSI